MAHPHLHHGVLGVGADLEEGPGQAQLIVLVALGLDGVAEAAEHGGAELLGGGLAHAAGDADHLGGELGPVVGSHPHHGLVAVRAEDGFLRRDPLHRVVEHHIGSPRFQGGCGEIMAVEFLPREGHEHAVGAHLAAVGGHKTDHLPLRDGGGSFKAGQERFCQNLFHCVVLLSSPVVSFYLLLGGCRCSAQPAG